MVLTSKQEATLLLMAAEVEAKMKIKLASDTNIATTAPLLATLEQARKNLKDNFKP